MENLKIGISVGDINGVGLEVILKTLSDERLTALCTPIIYGSAKVVAYHKNAIGLESLQFQSINNASRPFEKKINVVNCWEENANIQLGMINEVGGKFAYLSLEAAAQDLHIGAIDALVTAPIQKEAMKLVNFPYPGHTEYLTDKIGPSNTLMLMVHDDLRIGLVTNHVPVKEVSGMINKEIVLKKLKLFHRSLQRDFGLGKPNIAILGLNPHAGDGGVIGDEEEKVIRPAVVEAKKNGLFAAGPFSADGFFGSGQYKKFDGILAMYHDQGLIPFKSLSFGQGVNFTAGLDQVRTSPDHGTAMDLAGKNQADPSSFRRALYLAMDIARMRQDHEDMHANPLRKRAKLASGGDNDAPVDKLIKE